MINGIILAFSWIFVSIGLFFVFSGSVGFMSQKDFFVKLHAVVLSNCYGLTFILFGIAVKNGIGIGLFKILAITLLNIIITLTVIHVLARRAYVEGVSINAKRRDES